MREKLIELLRHEFNRIMAGNPITTQEFADNLIRNGVTIPVRCSDCKHYSHCESCYVWHTDPNPEDFCGRGEKKDPGEIDFDYDYEAEVAQ